MTTKTLAITAIAVLAAIGILSVLLLAHQTPTGAVTTEETVSVGVVLPLSGPLAHAGTDALNGITLALAQRPNNIILYVEDSQGTKEGTLAAANKLIASDNVQILIGEVSSGNTLPLAPLAEEQSIILLSPIASSPQLNTAGEHVYKFREDASAHGEFLATYAIEHGHSRCAILYDHSNDAWIEIATAFATTLIEQGGTISAQESFEGKESDYRTQLLKIKKSGPDATFFAGHPTNIAGALVQAKTLDIEAALIGTAALETPKLHEIAGSAAEGLIIDAQNTDCTQPPNERVAAYCAAYTQQYEETPLYYGAYAYDTMTFLLAALQRPQPLAEALLNTRIVGVTGEVALDEEGNSGEKELLVKVMRNGTFSPYEG